MPENKNDTVVSSSQIELDNFLAWQLQAEEYKRVYQLSTSSSFLSAQESTLPTYQFQNFQGEISSFTSKPTTGDGDCFFHAVGIATFTRDVLVQKLLDNPTEAVRQAFAHEIRQFLYLGLSGSHPGRENQACQLLLTADIREQFLALQKTEEELRVKVDKARSALGEKETHRKRPLELLTLLREKSSILTSEFEQAYQAVLNGDKAIYQYCYQEGVFKNYVQYYLREARGYIPFSRDFGREILTTTIDIINQLFELKIQVYLPLNRGGTQLQLANQLQVGEVIFIFHNGINHFGGLEKQKPLPELAFQPSIIHNIIRESTNLQSVSRNILDSSETRSRSPSNNPKAAFELDNIAILKKLKLFFMSNKYKGSESQDCELYNSVLEAHQAILVYVEDERVHKLFINDEPLETRDAIKMLASIIESLQALNVQNVERPLNAFSSALSPGNIDIKAHAERDVITITGSVTAREAYIGVDTVINNPVYVNHKPILDEVALDSKEARAVAQLKRSYIEPEYATIQGIFGAALQLEGQYINLQILCTDLKTKKIEEDKESKDSAETRGHEKYADARMASVEDLFGDKRAIKTEDLFKPVQALFGKQELQITEHEDKAPRLLLVQGRAGIGKTTFVHYVGHQWSKGQLYANYTWVFTLTLRKLRLLSNIQELSLSEWVRLSQFSDWSSKEFDILWRQRIELAMDQNQVLLILDGYDEMPEHHTCQSVLKDLLTSVGIYANLSLLITTRPCGTEDIIEKRRNLEIIGFTDENINQYIQTYFSKASNKDLAHTLTKTLRKQAVIWANAHIPLNLNLLCGIMEEVIQKAHTEGLVQGLAQLSSMTCLYQVMEKKLYERSHSRHDTGMLKVGSRLIRAQTDFIKHYQKERFFLAKLAFQSFEAERIIIPKQTIANALQTYVAQEVTQGSQRSIQQKMEKLAGEFFEEVCKLGLIKPVLDKSGLSQTEQDYEFLHLTFQEYYTAIYLAEAFGSQELTTQAFAEKIILKEKYNPRWQVIWWFVGGLLKENSAAYKNYLQQLQNQCDGTKSGQDIFEHYQLGLLIRCVDEGLEPGNQQVIQPIIEQFQARFLAFYQIAKNLTYDSQEKSELKKNVMDLSLTKSPFFLACRMSPKVCVNEAKDLYTLIPKAHESQDKCFFLAWMVSTGITTPKALCMLGELLADSDQEVRRYASRIVRQLDQAIITREFLAPLAKLLIDRNSDVRRYAIGLVVKLSMIAMTPLIIEPLTKLLADTDSDVRCSAAQVFNKLGAAAITPTVLEAFTKLLGDAHKGVKRAASEMFRRLGASAVTPQFLDALTRLLRSTNSDVQSSTAGLVGNLGAAVATPEILQMLAKLLGNKESNVRRDAAEAVTKMGVAAVTLEFLGALNTLLGNKNSDVRISVIGVIGNLGTVAATQPILRALMKCLSDMNNDVRRSITAALVKLGVAGTTPEIVDMLTTLLGDKDSYVRRSAVEAFKNLDTAATPQVLAALTRLLTSGSISEPSYYRWHSSYDATGDYDVTGDFFEVLRKVLANIESYAPASSIDKADKLSINTMQYISAALVPLLTSENNEVCRYVAETLCKLGIATLTQQIIDMLPQLLTNKHYSVRHYAADMISKLNTDVVPQVLKTVTRLLMDKECSVRRRAVEGVRELGMVAATPEILETLTKLLADENKDVRLSAAETIKKMSMGGIPQILKMLPQLLMDEEHNIRRCAAEMVARLDIVTVTPSILEVLTKLLVDENKAVRLLALETVSSLGTAAVIPEILALLPKLLMDEDSNVRFSTTRVLNNLNIASITSPLMELLPQLLVDKEYSVRHSAQQIANKLEMTDGPKFFDALMRLLVHKNSDIRHYAVEAVGNLNVLIVLKPQILEMLTQLLGDEDSDVRESVVSIVAKVGISAVTSQMLDALVRLLMDKEYRVRSHVAEVLCKLGIAQRPQVLNSLVQFLADKSSDVHYYAVEAINKLNLTAEPNIVKALVRLLGRDEDSNAQSLAGRIINKLGTAVIPQILSELLSLLSDEDSKVRYCAAKAINRLGATFEPNILRVRLSENRSSDVQGLAGWIANRLDSTVISQVSNGLMRLLLDKNSEIRCCAVEAVGELGATVATAEILNVLPRLLADENKHVCRSVAETLSKLGSAAATPQILYALTRLLEDKDRNECYCYLDRPLCCYAVEAVGALGTVAEKPEILTLLIRLLEDENKYVRRSVAEALEKLGSVAATPQVLDVLAGLPIDKDDSVHRCMVDLTIKLLDKAIPTPYFFEPVTKLCRNRDSRVCDSAAKVMHKIGELVPTSKFFAALIMLFEENNNYAAAKMICKFATVATPQIIGILMKLLVRDTGWNNDVRSYALEAVSKLGADAATPEMLDVLANLLTDTRWNSGNLSVLRVIGKLGIAAATSMFFDKLLMQLVHTNRDVRFCARGTIIQLGTTVFVPQFLDGFMKLLIGTDSRKVCWVAREIVHKLDAIAMRKFLYRFLDIFSVPSSKNNLLSAFEVCIDSIFPLFPSFWAENINHPNILDFVSHTLTAAYLNSHISCQIDFDKEVESNSCNMRSFVGKSSYLCSITPLQAQYLNLLSSLIIEQLSKAGKLDVAALKRHLSEWEMRATAQTPYANKQPDASSGAWIEPITYLQRSNVNACSQTSAALTEGKQLCVLREKPKPVFKTNNGSGF